METRFSDDDSLIIALQECKRKGQVSTAFMRVLTATLNQPMLKKFARRWLGSLHEFHWEDEKRRFCQPWNIDTVDLAMQRLELWKTGNQAVNLKVLPHWHKVVGEQQIILNFRDFVKVNKVITPSELPSGDPFEIKLPELPLTSSDLTHWIKKSLPYIIQKIQMWGCLEIESRALESLVQTRVDMVQRSSEAEIKTGPRLFSEKKDIPKHIVKAANSNTLPFSRLDMICCIINCVDVLVAQDLLKNMAMFPIALPLIIPSIFNDEKINVIPLLKHIPLKWSNKHNIVENYLFSSPYKLVLAIRLGSSSDVGKSCILNQVLRREYVFSSRQEPGARYGKPIALPGFVEFIPLTEETCKSDLWKNGIQQEYSSGAKDVILLANMHGDPTEHPDVFNAAMQMTTGVVAFIMPNADADHNRSVWAELTQRFGDVPYLEIYSGHVEEETAINTVDLNNDYNLCNIRKAIVKALSLGGSEKRDGIQVYEFGSIKSTVPLQNDKSKKIVELIQIMSCKTVKRVLSDAYGGTNDIVNNMVQGLCSVLRLTQIDERMLAMTDLERQVTELSNEQSIDVRCLLVKLDEELKSERAILIKNTSSSVRLADIESKIGKLRDDINDTNLGMEHFYRLLGKFYENTLRKNYLEVTDLPKRYAELLLNGFTIELLDGDASTPCIQGPWLTAICDSVCSTHRDLRVYVVTVIGLQSSGKSTLLNAMFGCKFAVSVGRCTRGLFLRLLLLDEDLRRELNVDAILVVDMEGLAAPENFNDPDSEKKDRLMATFAMGISNLALINIYGEAANGMTDILQIAIVAMARLEEAKMNPDLYVVQHLSEKNQQKLGKAHNEFLKAIQTAVKLTEEKGPLIGVINSSCLNSVIQRIEKGNVLKAFGPYRDGERVNSPPSQGYHESVVDLYKSILEACKECKGKLKLSVWSSLLQGYLEAVLEEQMAVKFKNVLDIANHLDREREVAKAKEAIENAFRKHAEVLEQVIIENIRGQDPKSKTFAAEQKNIDNILTKIIGVDLGSILQNCQSNNNAFCADCIRAVFLIEQLSKDNEYGPLSAKTLETFREATKESYEVKMANMIEAQRMQQGCSKIFQNILTSSMNKHRQDDNEQLTETEKQDISELVWNELKTSVEREYPYTSIEERIELGITKAYPENPNMLGLYRSGMTHDLRKMKAFKKQRVAGVINIPLTARKLSGSKYLELESRLSNAPKMFVDDKNIKDFSSDVMLNVKYYIVDLIQEFETKSGKTLRPKFSMEVHKQALIKFCEYFLQTLKAREMERHPQKLLETDEIFYKKLIKTRLSLGFSAAAEGHIIAGLLLEHACKKASKYAHNMRVDRICNEQWMINSENVRLKFFDRLATQVEIDDKTEATKFFTNPKNGIKKWFQGEVDNLYPDTAEDYRTTFITELEKSVQVIRNAVNMSDIKQHLNTMNGVCYEINDVSRDNMTILKTTVEKGVEKKKEGIKQRQRKPSMNKQVMARLGCIEHCPWCGALCWGHVGHCDDSGSTQKHHACHQPSGLIGTYNSLSQVLSCTKCDEIRDKDIVCFGITETVLPWKDAKDHFKEWNFDAHHRNEFNQLMQWFFLKLHQDIAVEYELQPASTKELQSKGFSFLSSQRVDRILATIKQKII